MTEQNLKKLIEQLQVQSDPALRERMRRSIDRAWNEHEQTRVATASLPIWRTIMRHPLTKLAAAAGVILAVCIGFVLFEKASQPAWADLVEPILQSQNAIITIVIGQPGTAPEIHDWVMGSRIRRTVEGIDAKTVIDLETSKILSIEPKSKTAVYIDLKELPEIPNYLEQLRNLIMVIQDSEKFSTEYLGDQVLEDSGQEVVGIKAVYENGEVIIWADAKTYAPVRIEQNAGQLKILCKDIQFDVEMEESEFSMEIPEGYKTHQTQLDLKSGTEENFIKGLKLWTEYIGDGYFPADVRVESYIKSAPRIGMKLEASGLTESEQIEVGMSLGQYVLFIRFYTGQGPWTYAGRGVRYGRADVPIFWYRPKDSSTYRVIYADLHVEDAAESELPAAPEPYEATEALPAVPDGIAGFIGEETARWHILPEGQIEVHSEVILRTVPDPVGTLTVDLPYGRGKILSASLNGQPLEFTQVRGKTHQIHLRPELLGADSNQLLCIWSLPMEALQKDDSGYRIRLKALIPVTTYELHAHLVENCGFVHNENPEIMELSPFSGSFEKPTLQFGSCVLSIKPIP